MQAALADPTVKPWTKLDTRRLTAAQKRKQPDELAHVLGARVPAPTASAQPTRVGARGRRHARTSGQRRPDPPREPRSGSDPDRGPKRLRAKAFPADFWLDDQGRVRRVLVDYTTAQGSKITVDTTYSEFGVGIDVTLPAPGDIADITPK